MRLATRVAFVAVASCVALAPFALAGGGRSVESERFEVKGNEISTGGVKCPKGAKPTGGGFQIEPLSGVDIGSRVISIRLSGGRGWATQIDTITAGTRDAKSIVVCRNNASYLVRESKLMVVDGAVSQINTVTAKCPRGSSLTGGGGFVTGGHNDMFVLESRPDGNRKWTVRTFTADGYVGSHVAEVICDPKNSHKYETATKDAAAARAAPRGIVLERKAKANCPGNSVVTGGGYALETDPNRAIIDDRPSGNDAWLLRLRTYSNLETYTAYARCLKG